MAGYPGQFGNVLITKESLDKFVNTLEGRPVIIQHQTVTNENGEVVTSEPLTDENGDFIEEITEENSEE